jgi:hypothetical protein
VYLFVRPFYNANQGISVKALYMLKGNCPCWFKSKEKKIFIFSAARFIVSEVVMIRNYPDIIIVSFCVGCILLDKITSM